MVSALSSIQAHLTFPRAGHYALLNAPLADADIDAVFIAAISAQDLRRPATIPTSVTLSGLQSEFRQVRSPTVVTTTDGVEVRLWSSVFVRSFYSSPTFAPRSGLVEHKFGYVLIFELEVRLPAAPLPQSYLFVQHEQAVDPIKFGLSQFANPIEMPAFLAQFLPVPTATSGPRVPRIERMAMRFMASSQAEVRQKTVEAHNVEAATSSLALHRTIPGAMTISRPVGNKSRLVSLSPHRQRIREGATKVSLDSLLEWVMSHVVAFCKTKDVSVITSAFVGQMAQPLLELVDKSPSSLLIERRELLDRMKVFLSETGRIWEPTNQSPRGMNIEQIMEEIAEPIRLDPTPYDRNGNPAVMIPMPAEVFFRPVNALPCFAGNDPLKIRVSSRTCQVVLPKGTGRLVHPSDKTKLPLTVSEFLNDERAFRVVFDAGRALYCSEGAFRSSNLKLAVTQLIHTFVPVAALSGVITEKGKVVPASQSFAPTSSFYVIENDSDVTKPSSILICDDDTHEWCDYIEIDTLIPRIRWLHAKVQRVEDPASIALRAAQKKAGNPRTDPVYIPVLSSPTLSASDLQEVVGQGLKNLAKLRISSAEPSYAPRRQKWLNDNCSLPIAANILRLRRPAAVTSAQLDKSFYVAASDPLAVYEVGLVVPNYSKAKLIASLGKIEAGTASQSTLQTFWLLSGFMHACLEVGAKPLIIMQP